MTEKDFDLWNKLKRRIISRKLRFYRTREIWWCTLGLNVGFEQVKKAIKDLL